MEITKSGSHCEGFKREANQSLPKLTKILPKRATIITKIQVKIISEFFFKKSFILIFTIPFKFYEYFMTKFCKIETKILIFMLLKYYLK